MKYIKSFESRVTNVDRKIELIKILTLDISDLGISVNIYNGNESAFMGGNYGKSNQITLTLLDNNGILKSPIYESDEIKEFELVLKAHKMGFRSRSGGNNFIVYTFDKHGSMTNSDSWKNL